MNALASLVFVLAGLHVGTDRILPVGYAPAWSPNGERIAFVTRGDLWVADADGSHASLLVEHADRPAWAPSGRRLAFERDGYVWTVRADGLQEKRLARGGHPAWAPSGERIALDRGGVVVTLGAEGGAVRVAAHGTEPAYARDGRIAYVRDGAIFVGPRRVAEATSPRSRRVASSSRGCTTAASTSPGTRWRGARNPTGAPPAAHASSSPTSSSARRSTS